MKKIIFLLANALLASACFAKPPVCTTIVNNNREHDVTTFSGDTRPYVVPRLQTFIFPEFEMGGVCPNDNDCFIFIRDNETGEMTEVRHFPNGAKITYYAKDQYQIDPHTNNACLN